MSTYLQLSVPKTKINNAALRLAVALSHTALTETSSEQPVSEY